MDILELIERIRNYISELLEENNILFEENQVLKQENNKLHEENQTLHLIIEELFNLTQSPSNSSNVRFPSNSVSKTFQNIENGNNHCYLAAPLGIIILIPGLIDILNSIFRIDLNGDWNSVLYYSIQFKLNECKGYSSNNTCINDFGDPQGLLGFLEQYKLFKYRQFIFNDIESLHLGIAMINVDLDKIVGIIFSEVTFIEEDVNNLRSVCRLQNSNINHWKSLIKDSSDFYLFDSIKRGYNPDVRYSFNDAFEMLLRKPFYIIYNNNTPLL